MQNCASIFIFILRIQKITNEVTFSINKSLYNHSLLKAALEVTLGDSPSVNQTLTEHQIHKENT